MPKRPGNDVMCRRIPLHRGNFMPPTIRRSPQLDKTSWTRVVRQSHAVPGWFSRTSRRQVGVWPDPRIFKRGDYFLADENAAGARELNSSLGHVNLARRKRRGHGVRLRLIRPQVRNGPLQRLQRQQCVVNSASFLHLAIPGMEKFPGPLD